MLVDVSHIPDSPGCTMTEAVILTGLPPELIAGMLVYIEQLPADSLIPVRHVFAARTVADLVGGCTMELARQIGLAAAVFADPDEHRLLVAGWAGGADNLKLAWHESANTIIPIIRRPYVLLAPDDDYAEMTRQLAEHRALAARVH